MMILDVMPIGPADIAAFRIGQGRAALRQQAALGRLASDQFVAADPLRGSTRMPTGNQTILFPGANHPMWSRGPLDFSHLNPRAQEALRGIQEQQELAYLFPPQMQHATPPPFFNPHAFQGCYMPQFNRQMVDPALIPGLNMNPLMMNAGRNNPGMNNPLVAGV